MQRSRKSGVIISANFQILAFQIQNPKPLNDEDEGDLNLIDCWS